MTKASQTQKISTKIENLLISLNSGRYIDTDSEAGAEAVSQLGDALRYLSSGMNGPHCRRAAFRAVMGARECADGKSADLFVDLELLAEEFCF